MKLFTLPLIIVMSLGYSAQRLHKSPFDWMDWMFQQQQVERQQADANKEIEARMELKRHWDKVSQLHREIVEVYNTLGVEQDKQLTFALNGIRDTHQDVIVSKLTRELLKKVTELDKINHVK